MIFVTSGHVDHGKSALLRALTGTDTAHLPEEKKRGLTIDLGYAYLPLENEVLGFIDVPGHQRFLSNMLAGLGGIQYALLVVAADEGVKPQTREHLEILRLLDFREIIVVITKSDRADRAQIDALILQLKADFPPLTESHFFVTSAQTGEGIESLKRYLISLKQSNELQDKPFRYAIDRVFSVKGAGLVVTGTAVAGKVSIGDELYLSDGSKVRIKNIHAQNTPSETGFAGQRLALNLANYDKENIERGDWITSLKPDFATDRITVKLNVNAAMNENNIVHLYHFASHFTGKVNLLTQNQAVENEQLFAEIILDQPLHIAENDKLILRSGDDSLTIAGATVLEIHSPKRRKRSESRLAYIDQLANCSTFDDKMDLLLSQQAVSLPLLSWRCQQFPENLLVFGEKIGQEWLLNHSFKQQLALQIISKLQDYHEQHQDQLGVTKARLHRIAALEQPESVVFAVIDELINTRQLAQTRGWIHTPEHRIALNDNEEKLWAQIKPLFDATNQALWVRDIAEQLHIDETEMRNLLYKIGKLGYLVPIVKDRFLSYEQIVIFSDLIKSFIAQHGEISVNQLRDEIGYGRKLTVQLMEYFDRAGLLRRKGNVHLLRDSDTY